MDDLACFRKQLQSTTCVMVTEENINKISESNRQNFKVGDYFISYFKWETKESGQVVISARSTSLRNAVEETKDKKFISYEGDFPIFQF